ncbi:LysM peptidoglycan-binding domain-containing M23 family metallopeptidase [Bosea beijingensis]|uniref:LysM peptidoglycan-binding domain-containing M23 family metallopeptidase n=1 Tax=Bosea beijingensis TaxID=3068632 RepID=UPI0027410D74|nr:LysM peptidoglycan-binding domain-containing M23 family metallopeptidase [Bosea sp. REN20]
MRFTETPFDSPFKSAQAPAAVRDPVTTGSIGQVSSAPLQPVASAPLVRAQPLPPPQSSVALGSPAPQAVSGGSAGWSAQGGTPVVLAQGETLDTISSRYGVPRAAIMSANGLNNANVTPGTRITIPVYNASGSASAAAPVPARQVAQAPAETQRFVAGPSAAPRVAHPAAVDTKAQAKASAEARAADAADARTKAAADAQAMKESRARFAAEAKAKADARKTASLPTPAAKPAAAVKPTPEMTPVKTAAPAAKPVVVASAPAAEPKPTAIPRSEPVADPKTTASIPKQEEEAASASDKADFRWPARGRVIAGYSGKGGNEGINIAVPEGTPIKAAEGGTVAYAGSELKGYGNLVLIRHPNGYVSAYAHNGELKVKRGDTVKRGQVVANSGQTGNVSSPQLHFELRKGSAPVDPTPYLNN